MNSNKNKIKVWNDERLQNLWSEVVQFAGEYAIDFNLTDFKMIVRMKNSIQAKKNQKESKGGFIND